MHVGLTMFTTDMAMRPDELAAAVEERGFESLWIPEHTHMPVDHPPYPGSGPLPDGYRRTLDPFVALTAAAGATSTLRLGTAVCVVAQRDPIILAKEVATLDLLSNGRLSLGIGFGWNRPETEHHGVPFGDRRAVTREHVMAAKAMWVDDVASFQGERVAYGPSWSWPKPLQRPHPPLLLGSGPGDAALDHLVDWADGWIPIGARSLERLGELRTRLEAAGRDPEAFEINVLGARPEPEHLDRLRDTGVHRAILGLPSASRDEVLPALDTLAAAVDGRSAQG